LATDTSDHVMVYDGIDTNAAVLGVFSGAELPAAVSSTGGSMYIHFESDDDSVNGGFLASFESEVPVFCSGMVNLNEQTDTLSDGSGNWNYHDNTNCLWRIMPEGASSVTLYFNEFETEAGHDLLKIFDLQTQQLLAEYSGTYENGVPDPVTSPSGKMFLTWTTNSLNTAPGWVAYFESNLVGINEIDPAKNLVIYPNPASALLNIRLLKTDHPITKLSLTDLAGRAVMESEFDLSGSETMTIDLGSLAPGIYLLGATADDNNTEYHRIVKE